MDWKWSFDPVVAFIGFPLAIIVIAQGEVLIGFAILATYFSLKLEG